MSNRMRTGRSGSMDDCASLILSGGKIQHHQGLVVDGCRTVAEGMMVLDTRIEQLAGTVAVAPLEHRSQPLIAILGATGGRGFAEAVGIDNKDIAGGGAEPDAGKLLVKKHADG